MQKIKFLTCLLFLSALIFQSCSVEKRRYTGGYHLLWKKSSSAVVKTDMGTEAYVQKTDEIKPVKSRNISETPSYINKQLNTLTASSEKKKNILLISPDSINCDTLIMRNGTEIKAKVLEITPTEVKYKYCNNLTGPTYVVYRYDISYVKYANGTLDSFVDEFKPAPPINKNREFRQDEASQTENYVRKRSVATIFFGAFSLIPVYGIPAGFIAIFTGLKCLRLIDKNPKRLFLYRQRTIFGMILGIIGLAIGLLIIGAVLVAQHII